MNADSLDLHIARLQASAERKGRATMLLEIIQGMRTCRTTDDVWAMLDVLVAEAREFYEEQHPDQIDAEAHSALDYMRRRQETHHE
jgi:hypothetical protein